MSNIKKWKNIQYLVWKRDCFKCVSCGNDKNIVVHHKDLSGDHIRNIHANNKLSNLVTLCQSCHCKEHWRMVKEKGCSNIFELFYDKRRTT